MEKPCSIALLVIRVLAGLTGGFHPSEVQGWTGAERDEPYAASFTFAPCLGADSDSERENEETWLAANRFFQMEANAYSLALVVLSVGALLCVALIWCAALVTEKGVFARCRRFSRPATPAHVGLDCLSSPPGRTPFVGVEPSAARWASMHPETDLTPNEVRL